MHSYAIEVAKKEGMDDVVAKLRISHEKQVKWYKNEIEVIKEWKTKEMELFMAKGKKIFLTTIENPDKKKIREAIENGGKIISSIYEKDYYGGIGKGDGGEVNKKYDADIINEKKIVSIAEQTIDDALSFAKEVAGVIYAGKEEIYLSSSEGINKKDKNSWVNLSIRAFAADDASGHSVVCSRELSNLKKKAGKEAGEIAEMAKNPKKGKKGTYDILLSPLAFANILSHVSYASSAFHVDNGMSFLAGKIGKKIGSEKLTLIDTGIHPDGIASRAFDDEGLATKETIIFEKGVLKSYLHNTSTALKYKTKTTRNAGIVSPTPWNAFVSSGDSRIKEMMEEIKEGIYITNVWYTRFQNYVTGDFSTIPRDGTFLLKDGEIECPIKEIRISDNMQKILLNIASLSHKKEQIYWWEVDVPVFAPHALIKGVKITKPFA